jgi:hypothetical protein
LKDSLRPGILFGSVILTQSFISEFVFPCTVLSEPPREKECANVFTYRLRYAFKMSSVRTVAAVEKCRECDAFRLQNIHLDDEHFVSVL